MTVEQLVTQLGLGGAFVWLAREYRRERIARGRERKAWRKSLDDLTETMRDLRTDLQLIHESD